MTFINNERHYQVELDTVYSKSNPIMVESQNRSDNFRRLGYQKKGNESLIGTTITDNKTNEQIFWDTGLTFDVHQVPLVADTSKCDTIQSNGYIDVPNAKALVNSRTGIVLSAVSGTYQPLNNSRTLDIIEQNKDFLDIENVINGQGGAFSFVSCAMKDNIGEVTPDDKIKRRMIFINSFNNAYSYKVVIIDFRLFCFNQMGRINKSKNKLTMKHSKNITNWSKHLPEYIAQNRDDLQESIQEFRAMKKVELKGTETLKEIFLHSLKDKLVGQITDKRTKEKRNKTIQDIDKEWSEVKNNYYRDNDFSLYGALNAITYQQTHSEGRILDENKNAMNRYQSLIAGPCGNRIDIARERCLALTK